MKSISERLTIEEYNGKQFVFVNYTGLKEKEMIELVNEHLALTIRVKLPFIADFHGTFGTPGYMTHARNFAQSTKQIIDKGAFLGIDQVKSFILKGVVLIIGVNYKSFDTKEEAIKFITDKKE